MISHQYRSYLKSAGIQLDLEQFQEIFASVAQGGKITVPRLVEHWFAEPANSREQAIHDLIVRRRETQATKWQQELFSQKKRLADAERKLTVKETKAAAESKRIASTKSETLIRKLAALNDPKPRASDGRIFPMHYAPVLIQDGAQTVVRLARYHCRLPGKPASVDVQYPGLYNARRDNLERYWRSAFGTAHAVLLVDSFYENVDRDGKNAVLHFQPRPAGTMLIACLYSTWTDPKDGKVLLSFAAVTDEPPAEVAAAGHDRMIVSLKPENLSTWLSPAGRTDAELQSVLSDRQAPFYDHEVLAA